MFFKSKRFLAVGMLLSMMAFAAAGCGGGDKKADAPKGGCSEEGRGQSI